MKWFKHQSDSNLNAKLQDLVLEYGYEGYGIYWYCLELIAGNVEPENMTFELEHDARLIAKYGGIGVQKAEEIMRHMVKLELFECSDGRITCLKLAKRCDDYTAKLVKQKGMQAIENKGVRESPTKSDKVPLEQNRIDKNKDSNALSRFREFWSLYDKKVDRAKCERKWKRITEKQKDKIFEVLPNYIKQTPDKQYRKNPHTWLNGQCWEDEDIQQSEPDKPQARLYDGKTAKEWQDLGIELGVGEYEGVALEPFGAYIQKVKGKL